MSIKGTLKARNAAKAAWVTRRLNKSLLIREESVKAKPANKSVEKPNIKVEVLDLKKLTDCEAYIFYTDGPTKITYSSKYKALKVSPHHIVLKG